MTSPQFRHYDALYAHLMGLYEAGSHAEALETAASQSVFYPANAGFLRYMRAVFAALAGKPDLALSLLSEMLDGGYFLPASIWEDDDFNAIRSLPAFDDLRARSSVMLDAAQGATHPECLAITPADLPPTPPLLIALHGNYSSVRWHNAHWRHAPGAGWMLAMPQSPQVYGLDSEGGTSYIWEDALSVREAVNSQVSAVMKGWAVNQDRVVIAGFSRGAEMAVQIALEGAFPVQGFIAICPGGPYSLAPEKWDPIIAGAANKALRGLIITGGQDRFDPGGRALSRRLKDAGIDHAFEGIPDMGHDYPPDFKARLLDFLGQF